MKPEQIQALISGVIEEKIPFNLLLGIEVEDLTDDSLCLRLDMRPDLIGNFLRGTLHGGVIASILDVAGGIVAWFGLIQQMEGSPFEEMVSRFSKVGTIDLRVDYLRPGIGTHFLANASILRMGNRIAVARMELHNDSEQLISVGTGSYSVG